MIRALLLCLLFVPLAVRAQVKHGINLDQQSLVSLIYSSEAHMALVGLMNTEGWVHFEECQALTGPAIPMTVAGLQDCILLSSSTYKADDGVTERIDHAFPGIMKEVYLSQKRGKIEADNRDLGLVLQVLPLSMSAAALGSGVIGWQDYAAGNKLKAGFFGGLSVVGLVGAVLIPLTLRAWLYQDPLTTPIPPLEDTVAAGYDKLVGRGQLPPNLELKSGDVQNLYFLIRESLQKAIQTVTIL